MDGSATDQSAWTVARLLTWTRAYFDRKNVESSRLCAEILLAHALQCDRINLYTRFEESPSDDVLRAFRESVSQAGEGKPIAYLTGEKEFFSLSFEVTPDVLIPRPETEVLVERTIDLVRKSAGALRSIVDLGTGSGCIAIALAKHLPDVELFASDVSDAAVAVAKRNAERHGVAQRIAFRSGDWFDAWSDASNKGSAAPGAFDVMVSNPPYIGTAQAGSLAANVRDFEPHLALFSGEDGLAAPRRLVRDAPGHVRAGGYLAMEIAFDQADAARELFDVGVWGEIVFHRDGLNHERVVQARLRGGPSPNA